MNEETVNEESYSGVPAGQLPAGVPEHLCTIWEELHARHEAEVEIANQCGCEETCDQMMRDIEIWWDDVCHAMACLTEHLRDKAAT